MSISAIQSESANHSWLIEKNHKEGDFSLINKYIGNSFYNLLLTDEHRQRINLNTNGIFMI